MTDPIDAAIDAGTAALAPSLDALVAGLPFPPVAQAIAAQASDPEVPALQALMHAARDILGTPAGVWNERELLAMAVAGSDADTSLRQTLQARIDQRWDAAREVVRQLRGSGAIDETVDDDAATLHILAVGVGMAMLGGIMPERIDANAWVRLSTRLLDSLAAVDPSLDAHIDQPQIWRARMSVPANPTAFAQILRTVGLLGVSVNSVFATPIHGSSQAGERPSAEPGAESSVEHQPVGRMPSERQRAPRQQVDMVLLAPRTLDRPTLLQAIEAAASDVILLRGLPEDSDDVAARVLRIASALARTPQAAPQAAAEVALADSWELLPAAEGPDSGPLVLRIQWSVEQHVVLRRIKAPFTRTEHNRAAALLELVASLSAAHGATEAFGWSSTLADGTRIWVRLARPDDADAVAALHARASRDSVYQRYFTPMNSWREENLRRISGGHRGGTLVACDEAGEVLALGNIFPAGPDAASSDASPDGTSPDGTGPDAASSGGGAAGSPQSGDAAEIAVLVDDAWHRQGIGRIVTSRLIELAPRLGFSEVIAYVLAENHGMIGLLEHLPASTVPNGWTRDSAHDLGATVVKLTTTL